MHSASFPPFPMPSGPMRPPTTFPVGLHHGFTPLDHSPNASQKQLQTMRANKAHAVTAEAPLGEEIPPRRKGIVVGEYHPLYPVPETPQYLIFPEDSERMCVEAEQRWCSKAQPFGTWGRADLTNMCDLSAMDWKTRFKNRWHWVFIHADGWNLNFWHEDFWLCRDSDSTLTDSHNRPIASLDIRHIFAVNVANDTASEEGYLCPWTVHLNFRTGYFVYRVKTQDEARAWNVRIMQGVVEAVKIGQMRSQYMHDLHLHDEVEPYRIEKNPDRMERLKEIWEKAVESVDRGVRPPRQLFFDLYHLYDALDVKRYQVQLPHVLPGQSISPEQRSELIHLHGTQADDGEPDGNLSMAEIEIMAKEFIEMKHEFVRRVVYAQEKTLYSPHKPPSAIHEVKLRWTIDQGRKLMREYERTLAPKDFFDRVVNFHHRTDISREGKVDVNEFMNAAPVFLLPVKELRAEGLFLSAAEESEPHAHREMEEKWVQAKLEGRRPQEVEADCNQQ